MMTGRRTTFLAWALVGLSGGCWAGVFALWWAVEAAGVSTAGRQDTIGLLIEIGIATLVFGAFGGGVAARQPHNSVGWLLAAVAALVAVKGVTGAYVEYGYFVHEGGVPGWAYMAWFSNWFWIPAIGTYGTFFFLLFPNGRPPSPRWRHVGRLGVVATAMAVVSTAFVPGPIEQFPYVANPLGASGWASPLVTVAAAGFPLLLVSIALAALSLVVRARQGTPVERAQVKWITLAALFLALGLGGVLVSGRFDAWTAPFVFGPLAGTAIASAIAIRRYRLFDIDRVVSRTVSYAIVTVGLAGSFALIALAPTTLLGAAEAPEWLIAAGTLIAVALFRPVRRRVQNVVDRRFDRAGYDTAHTIDRFTTRLREHVDLDDLGSELEGVVRETMHPAHVSLWIKGASE